MLIVLEKIKLEPKIGVLSQLKPIPFIPGKVGTQLIQVHQLNGITIFFIKMGNHFQMMKLS
jgi:hypothetical protein